MADPIVVAKVYLWGHRVGAVAEEPNGVVTFEYDPSFPSLGLEISPVKLPLSVRGPVTFPELSRLANFSGLPGVLADALPDRFGNAVIERYFSDQGRPQAALSPVQKLLYIGKRAMGALEFRPPEKLPRTSHEEQALEVASLVEQARRLIEGRADVAIPEIMRVGASAGGARAKALILWNREKERVRSGFAKPQAGDEPWLIKFDGVGEIEHPDPKPQAHNRIEYAYSMMARDAGVDMPETHLFRERRLAHFMARRFDRIGPARLHLHSLGGLHHVDYNTPGQFSYEQYLRTILQLKLGYAALEEAYRRTVFNIMSVNQDDHVKNFSFLMDKSGTWRLAPAYDLTYAKGTGFTRVHQMTLAGRSDDFKRKDLIELGGKFDIKQNGAPVIARVADALSRWPRHAREAGVGKEMISLIAGQFRLR